MRPLSESSYSLTKWPLLIKQAFIEHQLGCWSHWGKWNSKGLCCFGGFILVEVSGNNNGRQWVTETVRRLKLRKVRGRAGLLFYIGSSGTDFLRRHMNRYLKEVREGTIERSRERAFQKEVKANRSWGMSVSHHETGATCEFNVCLK